MLLRASDFGKEGAILDALSDMTSRRILNSLADKTMSIEEITEEVNVPMTTVYRHVHGLASVGLLLVRTAVTAGGDKYKLYKGCFRAISMEMNGVELRVWVEPNEQSH
jgi:predicted transcriptional regulator